MTLEVCKQRQSVLDQGGHCLVLGGAGSGKTTLGLLKAAQKTVEAELKPGECVLFLSFSRAAVARIREATRDQMPAGKATLLSIQTFHSFFWHLLQGYGYLLGAPRNLSIVLAHDEKALSEGIERNSPAWNTWEETRRAQFHKEGRICFDLFAPYTAQLLSTCKSIRDRVASRFPLILVDEAQDTSDDQWECIRLLSEKSQIICLADPDQMIYDFLPGVGPKRLDDIREHLKPHQIDLGSENNRSPTNEIAAFARDVLTGKVRGSGYRGVSRYRFRSSVAEREKAIRSSIGIVCKKIKDDTGEAPESIAILASYTSGVAIISAALQNGTPISHHVLFDEAFALLASRVAAFLLEPKVASMNAGDVATVLELAGDALRAKGNKTALDESRKCFAYGARCRTGTLPTVKVVVAARTLIEGSQHAKFTGDPRRDWLTVKRQLRDTGCQPFTDIASQLDYLVAFARGKRISESLSELWLQHAAYPGARAALDAALAQDQLLSGGEDVRGIYVMNMHKCKGKQFDGVILYRQQHHSPFVWPSDPAPHKASRRLLHMAIMRAKLHVLVLDDVFSNCPIMGPHSL